VRHLTVVSLAVLLSLAVWQTPSAKQTDLNCFMKEVLEKRDENWKKLQQYILDEREKIEVRGPTGMPIWGQRRDYQWFIRDGYFVRSPITADGVNVSEDDRKKYEEDFLKRAKARDEKEKTAEATGAKTPDPGKLHLDRRRRRRGVAEPVTPAAVHRHRVFHALQVR
jgi:hypothetical protein